MLGQAFSGYETARGSGYVGERWIQSKAYQAVIEVWLPGTFYGLRLHKAISSTCKRLSVLN